MMKKIEIDWEAATEIIALIILGFIATVAMWQLDVNGKEIALSIGSGVCGYLVKTTKVQKEPDKKKSDKESLT